MVQEGVKIKGEGKIIREYRGRKKKEKWEIKTEKR